VLGDAVQVNETGGYVRMVMGWGKDDVEAGRRARQAAAAALRREVRAIVPRANGLARAARAESEERDGLGQRTVLENSNKQPGQTSNIKHQTSISSDDESEGRATHERDKRERTANAHGQAVTPGARGESGLIVPNSPARGADEDLAAREEEAERFMSGQLL
jgi:hypothetical protein